jgi:hypothetical protein
MGKSSVSFNHQEKKNIYLDRQVVDHALRTLENDIDNYANSLSEGSELSVSIDNYDVLSDASIETTN